MVNNFRFPLLYYWKEMKCPFGHRKYNLHRTRRFGGVIITYIIDSNRFYSSDFV